MRVRQIVEEESARDWLRRHSVRRDPEYLLRKAVTAMRPHAVGTARTPRGYLMFITFTNGEHWRFGPFTREQIELFENDWYGFNCVLSSNWHNFMSEPGNDFVAMFKPYG